MRQKSATKGGSLIYHYIDKTTAEQTLLKQDSQRLPNRGMLSTESLSERLEVFSYLKNE
jgi:hypothetical protein